MCFCPIVYAEGTWYSYLVSSAFTSKPTSVGVKLGASGFSCDSIYAFAHEIIVIVVDQKLIYPIQFQSL